MGLDMNLYSRGENGDTELAYWRKFNALHAFIVNNAGKPDSNCEEIFLDKKTIQTIIDECAHIVDILGSAEHLDVQGDYYTFAPDIIEKVRSTKLCPTDGFFWGSLEIDSWFEDNVKRTLEIMTDALERLNQGEQIYYYSWW